MFFHICCLQESDLVWPLNTKRAFVGFGNVANRFQDILEMKTIGPSESMEDAGYVKVINVPD